MWLKKNKDESSEGSQEKFTKKGLWYKLDTTNESAEGLAETLACSILAKSNISNYVQYKPCHIIKRGITYTGCVSGDFLKPNLTLINSQRALELLDSPLAIRTSYDLYSDTRDNIRLFIEEISKLPGIKNYASQLAKILRFDAIICNEDRTLYNIAFIRKIREKPPLYYPSPLFDHGKSFMLSSSGWSERRSVESMYNLSIARPFSIDFNEQARIAEELSDNQRFTTSFSEEDLRGVLNLASGIYSDEILARAEKSVLFLMQKFNCYFDS